MDFVLEKFPVAASNKIIVAGRILMCWVLARVEILVLCSVTATWSTDISAMNDSLVLFAANVAECVTNTDTVSGFALPLPDVRFART